MALVLADRVRETTTTAGTGTITLLGAVSSCQSFAVVGNGNTTYYTIVAQSGTEWEVGIGTYTSSGTTLSRDTVLSSSNSGSLVDFSAGTKDVFVDYPAGKAVYENAAGNVDGYPITGGTIDNTTIGATTPSTGVFTTLTATGQTSLGGSAGGESFRAIPVASAVNFLEARGGVAGNTNFPRLLTEGADANIWMTLVAKGATGIRNFVNGAEQFRVASTASAVNYVQVTGAATTGQPTILATGSDSAVGLTFNTKGVGTTRIQSNSISIARFTGTTSAVNYLDLTHSITGQGPVISAQSISDSNTPLVLKSLGTGAIDLAAGSRGVNISNGGTVTALTVTANGTNYTSAPSVAITAPTTAGGVQATASVATYNNAGVSAVNFGGTGYTVGDTLSIVGGTPVGAAATLTVASVSGGVITSVTYGNFATYSALPTLPVSVTGGTGTGATFNIAWKVLTLSITNAGSGYVEQPTVTFSGGGGSGAAAYARVGSPVTLTSLGSTLNLSTEAGVGFRVLTAGVTATDMWQALSVGTTAILRSSNTTTNGQIQTAGTGGLSLGTNGGIAQCLVAHTASAVNYVQVTGAATGAAARISTQGSDSLVGLGVSSKGGGDIFFQTNGSSNTGFIVKGSTTAVNYLQVAGSAAGTGPSLSAQGSDTNIPLVLQPKGTGALQAQATTSTATGGNARGANAVDWQMVRNTAAKVASGQYSVVAGGNNNTASGINSFIGGGTDNSATTTYSTVCSGLANTSSGLVAVVAGGQSNIAVGYLSFIGGGISNATSGGERSVVVGGGSNTSAGYYNFVGGGFTNSATSATVVTTQSGTMNGTTAVTLSGSNASIKVGQYISGTSIAAETYVAAISGTSLTLSKVASGSSTSTLNFYTPHGVVVGGGNNQATGSYSFIGGGGDAGTAANRNVASGDWSTVAGGWKNVASGEASFIGGGGSFGGGVAGNIASGVSSVISGGYSNVSSATSSSIGGGNNNLASGARSTVVGGAFATTRAITGNTILGTPDRAIASTAGVSQTGLLILARETTDATATVLTSNSGAAGTTNQVILPNNSAYYFKVEIIANVTGGGNTSGWELKGVIKRGANAASTAIVGSVTSTLIAQDAGASTWVVSATADTTNGGLKITVTGQASTTIRWVAKASTTEVTF